MSEAVKVSSEVFEGLREEAQRSGLTIKDALQRRFDAAEERIRELTAALERQGRRLREREGELSSAARDQSATAARLATLDGEVQSLRCSVGDLQAERAGFADTIASWRDHAGSLEEDFDTARSAWRHEKEQFQVWILILGLAVLAAAAAGLWLRRRDARGRKESEPTPELTGTTLVPPAGWRY